jgi:hypothetical protein
VWTTWPIELVSRADDGSFLGYVMPYLDTDEYIDAQKYASTELRWGKSSRREQYKPAINLVMTAYWLHQNGYAVGDLSEQNVRIDDGTVTLIDCDSYSIEGQEFVGNMEAPRYTPPEGRGESHKGVKRTDRFGVAVHIFQFLMAGFHPYQAVGKQAVDGPLHEAIQRGDFPYGQSSSPELNPPPAAPDFDRLPSSIRRSFEQCFARGRRDPTARPSLQDWLGVLTDESEFDLDGVDTDSVEKQEKRTNRDSNWQENIREEYTDGHTASTPDNSTGTGTSSTADGVSTGTNSSEDESHWADDIRRNQTAQSDSTAGQSTTDQQSDDSQQSDNTMAIVGAGLLLLLMLVFVLLL